MTRHRKDIIQQEVAWLARDQEADTVIQELYWRMDKKTRSRDGRLRRKECGP